MAVAVAVRSAFVAVDGRAWTTCTRIPHTVATCVTGATADANRPSAKTAEAPLPAIDRSAWSGAGCPPAAPHINGAPITLAQWAASEVVRFNGVALWLVHDLSHSPVYAFRLCEP